MRSFRDGGDAFLTGMRYIEIFLMVELVQAGRGIRTKKMEESKKKMARKWESKEKEVQQMRQVRRLH